MCLFLNNQSKEMMNMEFNEIVNKTIELHDSQRKTKSTKISIILFNSVIYGAETKHRAISLNSVILAKGIKLL